VTPFRGQNVKRSRSPGQLILRRKMCHVFEMGRPMNFKLRIRMEYYDPHHHDGVQWPQRSKVKVRPLNVVTEISHIFWMGRSTTSNLVWMEYDYRITDMRGDLKGQRSRLRVVGLTRLAITRQRKVAELPKLARKVVRAKSDIAYQFRGQKV